MHKILSAVKISISKFLTQRVAVATYNISLGSRKACRGKKKGWESVTILWERRNTFSQQCLPLISQNALLWSTETNLITWKSPMSASLQIPTKKRVAFFNIRGLESLQTEASLHPLLLVLSPFHLRLRDNVRSQFTWINYVHLNAPGLSWLQWRLGVFYHGWLDRHRMARLFNLVTNTIINHHTTALQIQTYYAVIIHRRKMTTYIIAHSRSSFQVFFQLPGE